MENEGGGGGGGGGVYLSQIRRNELWSTSKNVNREGFFSSEFTNGAWAKRR